MFDRKKGNDLFFGSRDDLDSMEGCSEANTPETRRVKAWLKDRLERSKKLPKGELIAEVGEASPCLADHIMANFNIGNRPLRKTKIESFAQDMKSGNWKLTGQGISFNRDGTLNDGQNRLSAILKSGCTVPMLFIFGEEREVFDVYDSGSPRTAGDVFNIDRFKSGKTVAAVMRVLHAIEQGVTYSDSKVSNPTLLEAAREIRSDLENVLNLGLALAKALKIAPAYTVAALYLIKRDTCYPERFNDFYEGLKTGLNAKSEDNPVHALRDGFLTRTLQGANHPSGISVLRTAIIIKAWNLFIRGRDVARSGRAKKENKLSWDRAEERFPVVL